MYQFIYLIRITMMFTDVSSDFITDPLFVAWQLLCNRDTGWKNSV
jgi:hypothetical protein